MFDILTIGDATVDTFLLIDENSSQCSVDIKKQFLCLNYADKIYIKHIDQSLGGNAANVAVGMQRLRYNTAIMSDLGDDINGLTILNELKSQGIDTNHVQLIKNKQTRFAVVLNYQAERTILSYHPKHRYKTTPIPNTKAIYFTSLGEGFESLQKKVIAYKQKHQDTTLIFNPGSYQMNNALTTIKKLLKFTDVLFVNKQEAQALANKKTTSPRLFPLLHKKGAKLVIITDGVNGSYASDNDSIWHMPIYPIKPIAKTGAGDAYASGFLGALFAKKDIPTAMQWGTANACGVTQKIGAQQGLQTRYGAQKIIKKFPNIHPQQL